MGDLRPGSDLAITVDLHSAARSGSSSRTSADQAFCHSRLPRLGRESSRREGTGPRSFFRLGRWGNVARFEYG